MGRYFGAVDPGKSGAVAVVSACATELYASPIPVTKTKKKARGKVRTKSEYDVVQLRSLFRDWAAHDVVWCVEESTPRPGEARMTTWVQAEGIYLLRGMLCQQFGDVTMVRPQTWRAWLLRGVRAAEEVDDKRARKEATARAVIDRMPAAASVVIGKRGGLHDGMADAIALALWLRETHARQEVPHAA